MHLQRWSVSVLFLPTFNSFLGHQGWHCGRVSCFWYELYWGRTNQLLAKTPFARWRHFTTSTKIHFVFPFIFKFGLEQKCHWSKPGCFSENEAIVVYFLVFPMFLRAGGHSFYTVVVTFLCIMIFIFDHCYYRSNVNFYWRQKTSAIKVTQKAWKGCS